MPLSEIAASTSTITFESDLSVFTTAEIVLGEVPGLAFERRFDDATGFKELSVERRRDVAEVLRPAVAGVALIALGIALGRSSARR